MRRLRTWMTALLLGSALLFSTGCDRTTGALLVGTAIIGTALVLDAHDDHHRHHHHRHHGYHGGGHYGHGGHHGGHGSYHYDYCD